MAITKLSITGNTTSVGISTTPVEIMLVKTTATGVPVTPNDNITTTNVQAALEQLDDIKVQATNGTLTNPTISGSASFGTGDKAKFGAGNALQIYHSGSESRIDENGAGNFKINADNFEIYNSASSEAKAKFNTNGSVQLYYDNALKLETTSSGIDVTGDISLGDNGKAKFGASDDLQIYHASAGGGHSYIKEIGTGNLRIQGADITLQDPDGNGFISMIDGGAGGTVYLKHSGSNVLATTSTGIDVTGTVTADGLTVEGNTSSIDFTGTTGSNFINAKQGLKVDIDSNNNQGAVDFTVTHDGGTKNLFNVDESGDISFYEDTGTTPKFFWDASAERLGIGTASPSTALDVVGSYGTTPVKLLRHGDNGSVVTLGRNGVDAGVTLDYPASNTLGISTNGSERMRIDSSGNVGIGTTSPDDVGSSKTLHINDNTNGGAIRLSEGNTNNAFVSYDDSNGMRIQSIDTIALKTANAERMRIDSSGNVLVGKTSQAYATAGLELEGAGRVVATRDGASAGIFARLNSDGDIVNFRKGGTTVGSIGTAFSVPYLANGSNFGIRVDDAGSGELLPTDTTGSGLDASADLGRSNIRFKDLYLSGGVKGTNLTFSGNGSSEHARISSSGNVGIGESNPTQSKLVVNSGTNDNVATFKSTDAGAFIAIQDSNTSTVVGVGCDGDELALYSNNAERMRIDTSGNLGIGTSDPTEKLDINGDSIRIRQSQTPSSATATGTQGQIAWDANYMYVCTSTNIWKRVALATW